MKSVAHGLATRCDQWSLVWKNGEISSKMAATGYVMAHVILSNMKLLSLPSWFSLASHDLKLMKTYLAAGSTLNE